MIEENVGGKNNVVPIRPATPDEPQFRVVRGGRHCMHHSKLVDTNKRKVTCAACGAELDPFTELSRIAHETESIFDENERLEANVKALTTRLDNLRRIEKNTRERLKRLGVTVEQQGSWGESFYPFTVASDGEDLVVEVSGRLTWQQARQLRIELEAAHGKAFAKWEARRQREAR